MRVRWTGIVVIAWAIAASATAGESPHPLCPLVQHQIEVDREEYALDVELAQSELAATESIFALVDELWQQEAVERIVYLAAKHDRDVARLEVERHQFLLKRQEAKIAEYAAVCRSGDTDEAALAEAHRRYLQADCHRIGKDLAIAEVDLDFYRAFLAGVRDLREAGAATVQDIVRAERDVETARERIAAQKRRVEACIESGAASDEKP